MTQIRLVSAIYVVPFNSVFSCTFVKSYFMGLHEAIWTLGAYVTHVQSHVLLGLSLIKVCVFFIITKTCKNYLNCFLIPFFITVL